MKTIIIAWRFNPIKQINNIFHVDDDRQIILNFTPFKPLVKAKESEIKELVTLINSNKTISNNEVFSFLHVSQIESKDQKELFALEDNNCHLFLIQMAKDKIYELINIENAELMSTKCTKQNFDDIWEYYEILTIENIKNKIINLLLPLAIDFQGISDVEVTSKIEYLKEVLKESNLFKEIIINLRNILKEYNSIQHLMPIWDTSNLIKLLNILSKVDLTDNEDLQEIIKKYCSPDSKLFLPNWLKKTVEDIDEKIRDIK